MIKQLQRTIRWITVIGIGSVLTCVSLTQAASYTWTNESVSSFSDFWTNNASWNPSTGQPGTAAGDNAYLTNQVGLAYTNILDTGLAANLGTIAISNFIGQAWLTITNSTANPSIIITNGTLALGNGAGLELESGAVLSDNALTWLGTNAVINLNNGGQLVTAAGVTFGYNASSVTGQVTTTGATGGGWNFNNQALIFSNKFNSLTANNVALTNLATVIVGIAPGNGGSGLTLGKSTLQLSGNLTIGTNGASGNSLAFANGSAESGGNLTVGIGQGANSNALSIGGTGLSTATSNGTFFVGINGGGFNTLTVTNASVFSTGFLIGSNSSNNTANVSANTVWNSLGGNLNVGGGTGTGNVFTISGGVMTNSGIPVLLGYGNRLVISNGGKLFSGGGLAQINALSGSGSNSVLVTDPNSLWVHNGTGSFGLNMGEQANTSVGSLIVSNGATVYISGGPTVVGSASGHQAVTVTGAGSVMTNWVLALGNSAGAISNSLTISHGGLFVDGGATIGMSGGFNTVLVTDSGSVWSNLGGLTISLGAGGNSLLISNHGVVVDTQGTIGADSSTVRVTGTGSAWTNSSTLTVTGGGDTLMIANGGAVFATAGTIGSIGGGVVATVSDTNSILRLSAPLILSSGISGIFTGADNALIITNGGLVVDTGATIGGVSGSSSNTVIVTGAGSVWSNTGPVVIGVAGAAANSLTVTNGGAFYSGSVSVGSAANASNNSYNQIGSVTPLTVSNGLVSVGVAGGGFNTMIVTNANLSSSGLTIGNGASNNTVTVQDNVNWNFLGGAISVGNAANSLSNSLFITGSTASGAGLVTVGGGGNGGLNQLIVTNAIFQSQGLTVGNGSSSNTVAVQDNVNWNLLGGAINVGNAANSLSNSLFITGAILSNAGAVVVGGAGGGFNQLVLTNALLQSQSLIIGNGSSNNTINVLGNTTWNLGGSNLTIGNLAAAGNKLTLDNTVLTNVGIITIGNGKVATNATGNSLLVNNGGQLWAGGLRVGAAANDNNNSVQLLNGSVLEANSLVIAAGTTGNSISNVNAIYQFTTPTPTITPGAAGSIAVSNGTVSFRGIDNADVMANQGGALTGMTFAGANTFMLNAASNTFASADQLYTFQVVPGNPSNYVNLVMVNGQTDYGNDNLVIGTTGTMLVSNTTANIDQGFENDGRLSVVNATLTMGNEVFNNRGPITLQNATINSAILNFSTGTLHGNGTINGNVNNAGTLSPVGTLTFNGSLNLASSSVTIIELTGYGNGVGTNDTLVVNGRMTYAGQLVVTNTAGFAYAPGEEFQLFEFTSRSGSFSVTNLPDLAPYNLAWNTTELNTEGLLIVMVPEPATVFLLAAALIGLGLIGRRGNRPLVRALHD